MNTNGWPAIVGFGVTVIELVALLTALVLAVVGLTGDWRERSKLQGTSATQAGRG